MKKIITASLISAIAILLLSSLSFAYTAFSQKGLTVWDMEKASEGYTIFTVLGDKTVLVDMSGNVVHIWNAGGQEMLPPDMANGEKGHVLVGSGSKRQELDWDGKVVFEYDAKKLIAHHDWQKLPNGNYLILGRSNVPEDQIPAMYKGLGIEGEIAIKIIKGVPYGDRITEVTPDGKIVWDWNAYDHLDVSEVCDYDHYPSIGSKFSLFRKKGDWTHFNAFHYCTNPGYEDKILASNRHLNEVIMIDKATGEITWRWGKDVLGHQHDVQMIDPGLPGEGNILIFDNGYHNKSGSGVSQVLEVDPKTNEVVWFFDGAQRDLGTLRSWHISGCQRLPNGNTLITEGENGRIFEVTKEKEIVWEYNNPFRYIKGGAINWQVFRARRVPPSWVPANINLTPEMAEAASLMGQARSQYKGADTLVEQATQLIKYSK